MRKKNGYLPSLSQAFLASAIVLAACSVGAKEAQTPMPPKDLTWYQVQYKNGVHSLKAMGRKIQKTKAYQETENVAEKAGEFAQKAGDDVWNWAKCAGTSLHGTDLDRDKISLKYRQCRNPDKWIFK